MSGVARGKKNNNFENKLILMFFQGTHGFSKKIQMFGQL